MQKSRSLLVGHNNKKRYFFLSLAVTCLHFFPITINAQPDAVYRTITRGLDYTYNTRYDSAALVWQPLDDLSLKQVLSGFVLRWKHIPISRYAGKDLYLDQLSTVAETLKSAPSETGYSLYLQVITEMLLAEFHYNNGNAVQALWHARKSYPLMMKAFDEGRTAPELQFIKGMYLYYMDFFRARGIVYKTALSFFRDGDQKAGLQLLHEVAAAQSIARTEAQIYLAHIYLHLERDPAKAFPHSRQLTKEYPLNNKFRELYIENLLALEKYSDASPLIISQLALSDYYKVPALYFKGCLEQGQGRQKEAVASFERCVELAKKTELESDFSRMAEKKLEAGR